MAKKRTTSIAFLATIFVLAAVTFVAIFMNASADLALPSQPSNLPSTFASGGTAIGRIWDIIVAAAAGIFMVLLLIGGLQYLTSGGDEGVATKAKNLLRDALIGIIIVVLAWPIGVAILTEFGLHSGDLIRINDTRFRVPNAGPATDTSEGVGLGTENQSSSSGGSSSSNNSSQSQQKQVLVAASADDATKAISAIPIGNTSLQSGNAIIGPTGQANFNLLPGQYRVLIAGQEVGIRTITENDNGQVNWTFDRLGQNNTQDITFKFNDTNGNKFANLPVKILKQSGSGQQELVQLATTDSQGNINLQLFENNTYVIKSQNDDNLGLFTISGVLDTYTLTVDQLTL